MPTGNDRLRRNLFKDLALEGSSVPVSLPNLLKPQPRTIALETAASPSEKTSTSAAVSFYSPQPQKPRRSRALSSAHQRAPLAEVNNSNAFIDLTAPTPLAKVAPDANVGIENQPTHRTTYDPLGAPLRELEPLRPHLPPTATSRRARSAGRTRSAAAAAASPSSRNNSRSKDSRICGATGGDDNESSCKGGLESDHTAHAVPSFCASPSAARSEARPSTFARVLRPHAPVDPPLVAQRLNFSTPGHRTPVPPASSSSSTLRDSGNSNGGRGEWGAGSRRSGGQHGSRPSSHRLVVATTTERITSYSSCASDDGIAVYNASVNGNSAPPEATSTPQRQEGGRSDHVAKSLPTSPSFESPTPYARSSRKRSDYSDHNEMEQELLLSPSGEEAKSRALFHGDETAAESTCHEEPIVGLRAMGQVVSGGQLRDYLHACTHDDAELKKHGSSIAKHSRSAEKAPRRTYSSPYEAHDPAHFGRNGEKYTSSYDAMKSTQQTIRRPAAPRSAGRHSSSGAAHNHRHRHHHQQYQDHEPVVVPTPPRGNCNVAELVAENQIDSKGSNPFGSRAAAVEPRPPLSSPPGSEVGNQELQNATRRRRRPHPLHTSRAVSMPKEETQQTQKQRQMAEVAGLNTCRQEKLTLKVVGSSMEVIEVEQDDITTPRASFKTQTESEERESEFSRDITSLSPSLDCTRKVNLSTLDLESFATDNMAGKDQNNKDADGTQLLCLEGIDDDDKDTVAPSPMFDFSRKVNLSRMSLAVDEEDDDDEYAEEVFECDVMENSFGGEEANEGGSPSFDAIMMASELVAAMAKSGRLRDVDDVENNGKEDTLCSPPPFGVDFSSTDSDARTFELSAELAAIVDGVVKEEGGDNDGGVSSRRNSSGSSSRFSQWGTSSFTFEPLVSPRAPAPRKHSMCYFDPTLTVVPEDQAFALFSQSGRHVAANENDDQNTSPFASTSSNTIPATTLRVDDGSSETTTAEDLGATFSPTMLAASLGQVPPSSFEQHDSTSGSIDPTSSPVESFDLGFTSQAIDCELIDVVDPLLFSAELPTDTALFLDSRSSCGLMWFGDSDYKDVDGDATISTSAESGYNRNSSSRHLGRSSNNHSDKHRRIVHSDTYGQWMMAQCAKCCRDHSDDSEALKPSSSSPVSGSLSDDDTPFDLLRRRAFSDLETWLATEYASPPAAPASAPVDQPRDAYGNTLFLAACQLGAKRAVKWCIANGANVNAVNRFGNTGLHFAVEFGFTKIVSYLKVKHGALAAGENAPRNVRGLTCFQRLAESSSEEGAPVEV